MSSDCAGRVDRGVPLPSRALGSGCLAADVLPASARGKHQWDEPRWPVCCPLIPMLPPNVLNCWQVRNRHLQRTFLFCFVLFSVVQGNYRNNIIVKSRKASNLSNSLTFYYLKKIKINHKSQRYSHCVTVHKDRPARLAISWMCSGQSVWSGNEWGICRLGRSFQMRKAQTALCGHHLNKV